MLCLDLERAYQIYQYTLSDIKTTVVLMLYVLCVKLKQNLKSILLYAVLLFMI